MALILEDGTGKADAESYGSVAEFDTYWALRTSDPTYVAADLGAPPSVTEIEEALRVNTQDLDAQNQARWIGLKGSGTQALDWPRSSATDATGYAYATDAVPVGIKSLLFERAARYIANIATGLIPDVAGPAGTLTREKIKAGPVEIDTSFSGAEQSQEFPKLDRLLAPFIYAGTRIVRA